MFKVLIRLLNFKKAQNVKDWKRMGRVIINCIFTNIISDKVWSKVKKSGKTGKDTKTLISFFVTFLATNTRVLFLGRRLGTRLYLHPKFEVLRLFPKSQVFWQFVMELGYNVLYYVSSPVLLVANLTYTKIFQSSKICLGL